MGCDGDVMEMWWRRWYYAQVVMSRTAAFGCLLLHIRTHYMQPLRPPCLLTSYEIPKVMEANDKGKCYYLNKGMGVQCIYCSGIIFSKRKPPGTWTYTPSGPSGHYSGPFMLTSHPVDSSEQRAKVHLQAAMLFPSSRPYDMEGDWERMSSGRWMGKAARMLGQPSGYARPSDKHTGEAGRSFIHQVHYDSGKTKKGIHSSC